MAGFGGAVKLTGESEYKKALSQITQSLREISSQMNVVSTSYDSNDRSTKALAAQQEVLNQKMAQQAEKVNVLKNQYQAMQAQYATQVQKHAALINSYNSEREKLDEIGRTLGTTSKEYQDQKDKVEDLAREVDKSTKANEYNEKSMSQMRTQINNAQADVNKTATEIENLGKKTEKTGDGFTVFKGILANLGTQAINATIDGVKKLGETLIKVGKEAVDSFANYEQLVGGVETIFKDSADKVQKYASEAYKTAGISANEYMEQATSFSASLLQSLNDDTEMAAEYANRAIIDMADNANKMGTEIGSIQNAYQGFAKQNYTMLDNLKLGYGGTKTEMERLIKDASEMTDVQNELNIAVDNGDLSLGNIINAISVVQKKMGFMGTTTAEAAGTVSGSTGSMRAAWQNLLTGIADDQADLEGLTKNFVDSVVTSAQNLVPRIKQTVKGMSDVIHSLLSNGELMALVKSTFAEIIPEVGGLFAQIIGMIPEILLPGITNMLTSGLPVIIDAAFKLLFGVIEAVPKIAIELAKAMPQIIAAIVHGLNDGFDDVMSAAVETLLGIETGAARAKDEILKHRDAMVEYGKAMSDVTPILSDYNSLLSSQGNTLSDLDGEIKEAEDAITEILKTALKEQRDLRDEDVESIKGYLQKINELQQEKLEIYRSQQISELRKLQLESGSITRETAEQHLANTEAALDKANQATEDAYTARLTNIEQFYNAQEEFDQVGYERALKRAKSAYEEQMAENKAYYDDAVSIIAEKSKLWVDEDAEKWTQMAENTKNFSTESDNELRNWIYKVGDNFGAFDRYKEQFGLIMSQMVDTNDQGFLRMQAAAAAGGHGLTDESKQMVENMLIPFEGLPDSLDDVAKNSLLGMVAGMEEYIPELKNASNMSADAIVKTIREALDIHSPSRVLSEVGEYTVEGLVEGMKAKGSSVERISNELADQISKTFTVNGAKMTKIGSDIVTQIGTGFTQNQSKISTLANELIATIQNIFAQSKEKFTQIGKTIVTQIGDAFTSAKSSVEGAAKKLAESMTSILTATVSSFKSAGGQMANGVQSGFLAQESSLTSKVRAMMQRVVKAVKNEMQIHSPSKVFAEIGDFMAQGLGVGFTDEMKAVTQDINASIPTDVNAVGAKQLSGGDFEKDNNLVAAFKQALSEMKIVLDDEVAGAFVDKTVTNLIYA